MAVLGNQLAVPESGWRRYDDTHAGLNYTGSWYKVTGDKYFNGSVNVTTRAADNNYVSFSFYGTKVRIISDLAQDRHTDNTITVDGATESFNTYKSGTPVLNAIVYEKKNLPLGLHTVTITVGHNRINFIMDAIDIDESGHLYGYALATPESGWQRYDDANDMIVYTGTWLTETLAGNYNGSAKYTSTSGSTMSFTFYGTKIRIIGGLYSGRTTTAQVVIDGINVGIINEDSTTSRTKALVFEKNDLSQGRHVVQIKTVDNKTLILDAIDVGEDGYMTRSIGVVLTAPDVGWKRYDADNFSQRFGTDWKTVANTTGRVFEGGSVMYSSVIGNYIKFSFTGKKLRLVAEYGSLYDPNVEVSIDGVVEYINLSTTSSSYQPQRLVLEKTNLSEGIHEVVVKKVSGTGNFHIDAVDIDSDGRLFHPDEVTSIAELEVGKRIRCNYIATASGKAGVFGNLGKETSNMLSTPTSVPNVDFYFIMVDEYNKKKILVADRNVQSSISWDTLNSEGLIFGVQINLNDNRFKFVSRVMSGGYAIGDTYNEWDQYVVNSTLNNNIIAGDNNVWNWSGAPSLTSTTNVNSANRVRRGGTNVSLFGATASSTANSYRPLMEVEILPMNRSFINYKGSYKRLDAGAPEIIETHASTDSVPPMTSSITPSGFASASGYASTYDAWQAFSDKPSGNMAWICNARTGWICYRFDVPIVITKYTILPPSDNTTALTRSPKDWILEGSNDSTNGSDGTWVTLDSVAGTTGWAMNTKKEFTFANVNSYLCYRIRITLNSGDTSYVSVWQIELMERINAVPAIPSKWNTISATLPSEDTFINDGMDDLSVLDRKNEVFVQTMTANGSLGSGKMFKGSIDLKKYFEITSVSVK